MPKSKQSTAKFGQQITGSSIQQTPRLDSPDSINRHRPVKRRTKSRTPQEIYARELVGPDSPIHEASSVKDYPDDHHNRTKSALTQWVNQSTNIMTAKGFPKRQDPTQHAYSQSMQSMGSTLAKTFGPNSSPKRTKKKVKRKQNRSRTRSVTPQATQSVMSSVTSHPRKWN